jgi:guanosine-3',5'-bis(diphosphate) 3'-pyrophosphohydrolase
MPNVLIKCTHCGRDISVADSSLGQQVRCPSCRKLFPAAAQPVGAGIGAAPAPAHAAPAHAGAPAHPAPRGPGAPAQRPGSGSSGQGNHPKPNSPSAQGVAPRPGAAPGAHPAHLARSAAASLHAQVGGGKGHLQAACRPLLEAVSLAARAHKNQMRKDDKTPYMAHPFRVMLIVRHIFGIEDPHTLMAAVLHDTLEDTTTDWDDLHAFGEEVGNFVATLTKDKRRPEPKREEIYKAALSKSPPQVQICKLADVFDNLMDSTHLRPDHKAKSLQRARDYLAAIGSELHDAARRPHEIVSQLLAEIESTKAASG